MKHSTYLGLAVATAFTVQTAGAETVVYENDFSTQAQFGEMTCVNADGSSHNSQGFWNYNAYGAKNALIQVLYNYSDGVATPCDDYLVTPAMQLSAGHLYTITFNSGGYEYTKRLEFSLRTMVSPVDAPEPAAGDDFSDYQTLLDNPSMDYGILAADWLKPEKNFSIDFVPEVSGAYRLAFYAYNGGVAVDNIKVTDCGNDSTPLAVTDFEVYPAADGSNKALLSFTLPTMSATGVELTEAMSVKIIRTMGEDVAVYTKENCTPGKTVTYTDDDEPAGVVTYAVQVVNGDELSDVVEKTVFVGVDVPKAVSGLAVSRANGISTLTWLAPTEGVNGSQTLELTYDVARVLDGGEPEVLATGLTDTCYEDAFEADEMVNVVYTVTPVNFGTVSGAASETTPLVLGAKSLPFADSFADKTLDETVWTVEASSNSYKWTATSSCRATSTPYDDDNGFMYYNAYNAYNGYWSRLITPPLKLSSVGNPMVSFALYMSTSTNNSDRVVVEVSMDNGEWITVEGSEVAAKGSGEWKVFEYSLADFKDCESARVSFKAISGYGSDIALDAVSIYGGIENDLAVSAFSGSATVVAGGEAEYIINITNLGGNPVSGSDYDVEFYANGQLFDTAEGVDVDVKGEVSFGSALSLNASHIGDDIEVYAKVVFDADEVADNNESSAIVTSTKAFGGPTAMGLVGEQVNDKLVLTWSVPENESFDDAVYTVDGEGLEITPEEYAENQAVSYPGDMNGWTNLDIDGIKGLASFYPGANPSDNPRAFQYISVDFMGNSNLKDGFGDGYIMAFPPSDMFTYANDWLVSPVIPGAGMHTLSMKVKGDGNSYGCMGIKFDVLYSTSEEYSSENPADSFTLLEAVNIAGADGKEAAWLTLEFDVPADAKRVAINFNAAKESYSRATGYSWVKFDDITLECRSLGNPRYNVYVQGASQSDETEPMTMALYPAASGFSMHNAEPLEEATYTVDTYGKGDKFRVSALYSGGESELSEEFEVPFTQTGVAVVESDADVRISVAGHVVSAVSAGEAVDVKVFTPNGALAGAGKVVEVGTGVYIVEAAGTVARVVVR